MKRRSHYIVVCIVLGLLAAGAFLAVSRWDRSPKPPDLAKLDVRAAIAFEASDDYNRMSEARRIKFSRGVIGKLHEMSFEDMLGFALNQANMDINRRRLENMRKLPNFDALHGELAADFLRKFYQLPEFKRQIYLGLLAVYQDIEARIDPDRYKKPGPDQFYAESMRLFAAQSPVMKAYGMQFMIDLKHQRQKLGLKDLPLPMR
ncbi:MAG: hypothetical protein ABSH20_17735 [Tepidisphaeraceae bacterium]|jgi:hypothetical protein